MPLPVLAAPVFVASLIVSAALTWLAGVVAARFGVVDRPGGRKEHAGAVPLLGGAAIAATLVLALGGGTLALAIGGGPGEGGEATGAGLVGALIDGHADARRRALAHAGTVAGLLAGIGAAFAVGLADDLGKAFPAPGRPDRFPAAAKLAGQIAAAGVAVAAGARTDALVDPTANVVASVLWIVAVANAFNFLDHADGLAAGVGLIATAIFGAVALVQQQYLMALALAALGGALAGFLIHNLPPARIFLGDAGALAIGQALGSLTLLESYVTRESPGYLPVLLPPIVLALPLFDMAVVVASRVRRRAPVHVGDRNHLHHRLVRIGMSPRAALGTTYLATLALGAGALLLPEASWVGAAAIAVQTLAVMGLVAILMFFGEGPRPA